MRGLFLCDENAKGKADRKDQQTPEEEKIEILMGCIRDKVVKQQSETAIRKDLEF
jgi:hypothetical protein